MTARSNFGCALHYYEQGILFIGRGGWLDDGVTIHHQLCLDLYEGAADASLAVRNDSLVKYYTEVIFQNVPFEDSLPAWITLMTSLESSGQHKRILDTGLTLIQRLNIDVPKPQPSPVELMKTMSTTIQLMSNFDVDRIATSHSADRCKRNSFKIFIRTLVAAFSLSSPYLPHLTCEMVRYSLQNNFYGVESSVAFAGFAFFNIVMKNDYAEAKYWANIALEILNQWPPSSVTVRVNWMVYGLIIVWFVPLQETKRRLLETYQLGMKIGSFSTSMYPLCFCSRIALLEGENLSVLHQSNSRDLKTMTKYNLHCAKLSVLDMVMIDELRGIDSNTFSMFNGSFGNDEKDIIIDAQLKGDNYLLGYAYQRRFFSVKKFSFRVDFFAISRCVSTVICL